MKKCAKCGLEKNLLDFSFKSKAKNILHSYCKQCTRAQIKNHYDKNRQYYLKKTRSRNKELRLEILAYLYDFLLNKKCIDCGESDMAVLEFDHTGKIKKSAAVSSMIRIRLPLEKIKEEVAKCEIRCANCHRRKTARDFNWYKVKPRL